MLVRGHPIFGAQRSELLLTMRAHPLLTPTYTHTGATSQYREFCAALTWLDAGHLSLAATEQLPPTARSTLCVMLGIQVTPTTTAAQALRIFKYVELRSRVVAAEAVRAAARHTLGQSGGKQREVVADSMLVDTVAATVSSGGTQDMERHSAAGVNDTGRSEGG